jgi:uncharacterized membrane protein YedE/YeeE
MESNIVVTTIIVSVFSIIVASSWRDLIDSMIEIYIPNINNQLRWKAAYVIAATLILLFLAVMIIPRLDKYLKVESKKESDNE